MVAFNYPLLALLSSDSRVSNCSRCSYYITNTFPTPIKFFLYYKFLTVNGFVTRCPPYFILSRSHKFSRCPHCDLLTFGYRCRLRPGIRHSSRKMYGGPDYSPFKLTPVAGSNKDGHSKTSGRLRNPVDIPRQRFMIDYYNYDRLSFSILLMRRARVIVVFRG